MDQYKRRVRTLFSRSLYKGRVRTLFNENNSIMDFTIDRVPDVFKDIYRKHWNTIKHSVKRGIVKDVYHYPLLTTNNSEIRSYLQTTLSDYNDKIKINVCFGFILRERLTNELKFFHPSNNTMLFDTPRLIQTPSDYNKLVEDIEKEDAFEYARNNRPSTKWIVERIICIRFDIYRL